MSTVWFVLAGVCLLAAAVLMYLDRDRPTPPPPSRSQWAEARGLDYRPAAPELEGTWHRGVFDDSREVRIVEVAEGLYEQNQMYVFDVQLPEEHLEDGEQREAATAITVVAMQRPMGSPVVFDLRSEHSPAPGEDEVEMLGAVGRFFAFSDDLDVARRVVDRRMVAFAEAAPDSVEALWSEDDWVLCWAAPGAAGSDHDDAIAALARFSGLLAVLPPDRPRPAPRRPLADPGR